VAVSATTIHNYSRQSKGNETPFPAKTKITPPRAQKKENQKGQYSFSHSLSLSVGSRSRSSEKGKREMDISEEQRAAHKREFLEFLDQDVRTYFSLSSLSIICV